MAKFRKNYRRKPKATKAIDVSQDRRIRKLEKKVNGIETKHSFFSCFNNTDGVIIPLNTAAVPKKLISIDQGSGYTQRVGMQVDLVSTRYRARVENDSAANQFYRCILFRWKSDAVPNLADVLLSLGAAGGIPDNSLMPYSSLSLQAKQMTIIKDICFWLAGTGASSNNERSKYIDVKLPRMRQHFYDTGAQQYTDGYYVLWQSTNGLTNQLYDMVELFYKDA